MDEPKNTAQFHAILLGVIFDPAKKKILIGKHKPEDNLIKEITWSFPGGELLAGQDPDKVLKEKIKGKTGYDVKNLGTIFSKVYPEAPNLLSIYFLCEIFGGQEQVGQHFSELKWVSPDELEKHFTTSFHPALKEYILNLH